MLHVSIYTTVRQEYMFLVKFFYKIFCAEWISFNLLGIWFRGLFVYLRAHVLMNPIRSVQMVCFSYLTFRVYVFAEQKKKRRKRWFLTPSLWAHTSFPVPLSLYLTPTYHKEPQRSSSRPQFALQRRLPSLF